MSNRPPIKLRAPLAHRVVLWALACDHKVRCGCPHEVGSPAYCWLCGNWRTVVDQEIHYYTIRQEAYRA